MCLGRPFFPIWKKKILTSLKGSREKKGGGGWKPALPQFFLSIVSSSLVRLLPPPPAHAALPGRGHQADITTQSLRGFFFLFFKQERAHPPAVCFNCLFFGYTGSLSLCAVFLYLQKPGLLSSFGTGASLCGGFSCCRMPALGQVAFSSCPMWTLVTRPAMELTSPVVLGQWETERSTGSLSSPASPVFGRET